MEPPVYDATNYPSLPLVPVTSGLPDDWEPPVRMPRDEALTLTRRLKRGAIWGSLAAFVALIGLAAQHVTGVAAAQVSPSTGGGSSSPTPADQQGGGFFGNQPGSGNFGTGSGGPPISGTSVS